MNKQEIIDSAMQLAAGIGNDPLKSIVVDADMTAEDLLPLAFRHAYREMCRKGANLQDVSLSHSIELTASATHSGMQGDLPEGVLTEYLDHAFLPEHRYSSFMRYVSDYDRERLDAMLCYWTVDDGVFYTTCVEEESGGEDSGSEELTIVLRAPSVPAIPSNPATDIDIPVRARDAVIHALAMMIRGEINADV